MNNSENLKRNVKIAFESLAHNMLKFSNVTTQFDKTLEKSESLQKI